MNVLVTGGAGFIGSHTVTALVARGDRVRVLDDLSSGQRGRLAPDIEFMEGDVRDRRALAAALVGIERVLHLAAVPSVARSLVEPGLAHDVNAGGTVALLEASRAAGVRRVVVASSSSVYGDCTMPGSKHEDLAFRAASPYAASKVATECYTLAWSRSLGLEGVALRYFNVFGPGQDPASEYAAVIPRFIVAGLAGHSVTVHGDGEQTRDFTPVENVVHANLLALTAPAAAGEAVNIACGDAVSVNQLVREIETCLGRRIEVIHGPPRPGDVRHSLAALDKAQKLLGYTAMVPFATGLKRTFASFRAS